ncbi:MULTISPECIES: DoxX family protein [Aequorivita]|uniref:DoxX family protein n=2 Tax=Aequorivita TaxID=153265 RepID=A0AB35YSX8_9FLAO|nr:DoxX family protein [Aequorivita sp. Ant34-E75]WGF91458.1 DoxX family protein [Aequorivita sp. Ant34-E75]
MQISTSSNIGLLLLRIGFGGMMLTHGIPKLLQMFSGDFAFGDPIGIGTTATLVIAVICEVFFPLLVIIGFRVRIAAIPIIVTMAVAAFIVHAADPLGTKEMAILYMFGFTAISLLGSGKYAVDKR